MVTKRKFRFTSSDWFEARESERESCMGECGLFDVAFCDSGELSRLDDEFEFTDLERDFLDDDIEPFSTFSLDSIEDDVEFEAEDPGRDSSLSIFLLSVII